MATSPAIASPSDGQHSILSLVDDSLSDILSFFSQKELLLLRRVCETFKRVILARLKIAPFLDHEITDVFKTKPVVFIDLLVHFPGIQNILLFPSSMPVDHAALFTNLSTARNLEHFVLRTWKVTDQVLLPLQEKLNFLTELNFGGVEFKDVKFDGLIKIPHLKRLYFYSCKGLAEVFATLPELGGVTTLELSECSGVSSSALCASLAKFSNLEQLLLGWRETVPQLTDEALESVAKLPQLDSLRLDSCSQITALPLARPAVLQKLKSLKLSQCPNISMGTVRELLLKHLDLEELQLESFPKMDDGFVAEMFVLLKKLQFLSLFRNSQVTDASFATMTNPMPLLTFLDIDSSQITNATLISIYNFLPNLTFLNLNYCAHVSHDHIQTLTDRGVKVRHIKEQFQCTCEEAC